MNTTTTQKPRSRSRWVNFDLDLNAVVKDYARRFVDHAHEHETVEDYCQQALLDTQIPGTAKAVRAEIRRLQSGGAR